MKVVRDGVFETNSSSTHSLVCARSMSLEEYVPNNSTIKVRFIDTDDLTSLRTLAEKVSYLVSHIVNGYKYNAATYDDLIEDVKNSWSFKKLNCYVEEHYNKSIVFPESYKGDLEEIVNINHQLIESDFDSLCKDIVSEDRDYLGEILSPDKSIDFGRD